MYQYAVKNVGIEVYLSDSMPDPYQAPIKSEDNYEMCHILELLHSEHDDYIIDVELQKIQAWLIFSPYSKFIQSKLCFYCKYGGSNVEFANFLSKKLCLHKTGTIEIGWWQHGTCPRNWCCLMSIS